MVIPNYKLQPDFGYMCCVLSSPPMTLTICNTCLRLQIIHLAKPASNPRASHK